MDINGKTVSPYKSKKEFYKNIDKTPHEKPTNAYNLDRVGGFCGRGNTKNK